ncbi:hypothetical protein QO016_003861 [Methylobacterium persicinum]|uniref:FAD-binding domain-containing protein n=2 Tax=Methylobacterium persicinum TaxID=374426 RepID=A0ABU0HPX7_9HYPH|nr:hypothetical protein [Methylobacterium persicinum]
MTMKKVRKSTCTFPLTRNHTPWVYQLEASRRSSVPRRDTLTIGGRLTCSKRTSFRSKVTKAVGWEAAPKDALVALHDEAVVYEKSDCFWGMRAIPDHRWDTQSRLTILGDAAHAKPPFTGEGVNLALLAPASTAGPSTTWSGRGPGGVGPNTIARQVRAIPDFQPLERLLPNVQPEVRKLGMRRPVAYVVRSRYGTWGPSRAPVILCLSTTFATSEMNRRQSAASIRAIA